MLRRIIAIAIIVIGIAALVGAVGSATFWRPDDRVTATMPAAPQEPVVVTAPGVLDMVDDTVEVRVVGATDSTPVVLAMGREADVHAWIDGAPYVEITGLTTWEQLAVRQVEAVEPEPDEDEATEDEEAAEDEDAAEEPILPDPAGSDLWIEEVTGTAELTYEWTVVPGRWVLLAASDGTEPAPQVELTWDREVETPLLVPGLIVGGVLVLAGLIALILFLLMDRETARARRARTESEVVDTQVPARREGRHREPTTDDELSYAERLGWPSAEAGAAERDDAEEPPTDTGELPTSVLGADGEPLTRRELRERERARQEAERASAKRAWWRFGSGPAKQKADGEGTVEGQDVADGDGAAGADGADRLDARHGTDAEADAEHSATELSDWVSSGRSGTQAGPIRTYPAAAPGATPAGTESAPGSGLSPSAATPEQAEYDAAAVEPEAGDEPGTREDYDEERPPVRWQKLWGRKERHAPEPEAPEDLPEGEPEPLDTEDPHSSGARWRKTWGIQQEDNR
ncbi:hypothetical protein [Pseudactinotalea sp. Z1732]|uniref:hypothetical protein n=1 Tax=Micrococcales TaxID=85006 RepID=UPI003C7B9BF1